MTAPRVRLISRENGVGLSRDLDLMQRLLAPRFATERVGFGSTGRTRAQVAGLWGRRLLQGRVPLQIFSERVYPRCLPLAERNFLLPNPEWFLPRWHPSLARFDAVLCKTRHAERIFAGLGCTTRYIGFTSEDRLLPDVARQRVFFHLAGRSSAKGTRVLLDTWRRHPQWPLLIVVQNPRTAGERVIADNIDHRIAVLDEAELRRVQNQCLFHICPSETEGYGHYLMEALSVGAVTLTTDGEPMNELVTAQRGLLMLPAQAVKRDLAWRYYVDPAGIELAVTRALRFSDAALDAMSRQAREHFVDNQEAFIHRFQRVVTEGLPLQQRSMPALLRVKE